MQFNVLGSLEVIDGDRYVPLGGHKQRAVLALLVLSANRVIAVDRLVDELWPDEPPAQARNALQTYISKLRSALEPERAPREPARILCSQAPGYVLTVDPKDIDAARFEHAAREGRTLLKAGDAQAAHDELVDALRQWRGPALAEFAHEPFARGEAARLEELRLVVLEDRIAADLALGEHAAVIGELQRLVEQEPLREQLWSHLVRALYRCGRQGDALAAYQRCRQSLAEELGIDPSPALRQLQLDVLQQSPALEWRPAEAPPAAAAPAGPTQEERVLDPGTPFLLYRDELGQDRTFSLDDPSARITIGRGSSTDIWLSWDGRVSRLHAALESSGGQWAIIDNGLSSNGSFVNDERVKGRRVLHDRDVLQVGDTVITYRHPLQSSAAMTRD